MATLGVLDYLVFAGVLLVSTAVGVYHAWVSRKNNTANEFLLGSRSLGWLPVSFSTMASFISALSLLGIPAEVYQRGTSYIFSAISFLIMFFSTSYFFLPVLHKIQLTSVNEYLELRFTKHLRILGTIISAAQMLIYIPLVLYAPALALAQATGLDLLMSVLSVGVICTFYTSIGGIKAVVWTDVFQSFLMYGGMIMIIAKGTYDQGGIAEVWNRNYQGERLEFPSLDVDLTVRHTIWSVIVGGYFSWTWAFSISQIIVQRYLTIATLKDARRCVLLGLISACLISVICGFVGMVMYGFYHDCDPILRGMVQSTDQMVPFFAVDAMGSIPGVAGIFIAGIFSGSLSTASSGINSLAALTMEDFIKPCVGHRLSEICSTRILKLTALLYGVLNLALVGVVSQFESILQSGVKVTGIFGCLMGGVFTLGMFSPWTNSVGAFAGLISGVLMVSWIEIGNMVYKTPIFSSPMSVAGCPNYVNMSGLEQPFTAESTDVMVMYRLSYLWSGAVAFVTTIIVGTCVTILTGKRNPEEVDARLITPCVRALLKKRGVKLKYSCNRRESSGFQSAVGEETYELNSHSYPKEEAKMMKH